MPLAIRPVPPLTPAQVAALSDFARSQREVTTAYNAVVRQAQLDGTLIPIESRAARYKSPVLRITERVDKTPEWRAAALVELARQEADRAREAHRSKRVHNRRVATKVAKRKTRAAKRKARLPSPPHKRKRPHSSDDSAENAQDAVHLGGVGSP